MKLAEAIEEQVRALDEGRAFVPGFRVRTVEVTGADAAGWLNDLVTAGVEDIPEGRSVRSLLLTPTGRVRADFHVLRIRTGFLLAQGPDRPEAIDDLLGPYVLSSDVALREVDLMLVSVPEGEDTGADGPLFRPSILGSGTDLVLRPAEVASSVAALLRNGLVEAGPEAIETWRIRGGIPRFPVDFGRDSLPAEAGLEPLIDFTKGCFLGQEAVAKVRNLGHPPRVVVALQADRQVERGERVVAGVREAGEITSAAPDREGSAVIARVRWDATGSSLSTAGGAALSLR